MIIIVKSRFFKRFRFFAPLLISSIVISGFAGGLAGYYVSRFVGISLGPASIISNFFVSEEEAVIETVQKSSPAVVSIVATKDLPVFERTFIDPFEEFFSDPFVRDFFGDDSGFLVPRLEQKGFEKREVSAGTGFLISSNGLILTNKHVIDVSGAEFTVILNNGQKFSAKIMAKDNVLDLALIKIEGRGFPFLILGDSDKLQIGQTVIAIGNALGEFKNTVSKGVISGLFRSIVASSGSGNEKLEQVIQTDAAINRGNSGGPLLNLKGEVVGINAAIAVGAQNIGFAIPINQAKPAIQNDLENK